MKVLALKDIAGTDREVHCPKGNFISNRFLLEKDGMGYSLTKTIIKAGTTATWHYKHHLETCYCISGKALLINNETKEYHSIEKDSCYILNNHDNHTFMAIEDTELLCVFNPPLIGDETHREDGSYGSKGEKYV